MKPPVWICLHRVLISGSRSPPLQGDPGDVISTNRFGEKGAVGLPGLPGVPVSLHALFQTHPVQMISL